VCVIMCLLHIASIKEHLDVAIGVAGVCT
jgi:hypothetical protein